MPRTGGLAASTNRNHRTTHPAWSLGCNRCCTGTNFTLGNTGRTWAMARSMPRACPAWLCAGKRGEYGSSPGSRFAQSAHEQPSIGIFLTLDSPMPLLLAYFTISAWMSSGMLGVLLKKYVYSPGHGAGGQTHWTAGHPGRHCWFFCRSTHPAAASQRTRTPRRTRSPPRC